MPALAYRLAVAEDMPLIVSTWSDSYRTSRSAGLISMARWQQVMEVEIRDILARDGVSIHVAHHPGETDRRADLYGWIAVERGYEVDSTERRHGRRERRIVVSDRPLVLYVYVKAPYRRLGIARGLFAAAGVGPQFNYACRTGVVSMLASKIPEAEWLHLVCRFPKSKNPGAVNDGARRPQARRRRGR